MSNTSTEQGNMKKVYVTNYNPQYGYDAPSEHGEMVFMTEGVIPTFRFNSVMETFEHYAKSASDDDSLFLSGPNIICAMAVTAWLKHRGTAHLLQHGTKKDANRNIVPTCLSFDVALNDETL